MPDAKAVPGDPPETANEPHSSDSVTRGADILGVPLPASDRSDDYLIGYAQGLEAGWEHGRAEGYDRAFREADAAIAAALTQALGGPEETDRAAAVRRHLKTVDALERRKLADAGELVTA
jgi:hypothetical protein